ncbi:TPA: hypothetical protein ACXJEO_000011 [Serratia marcescens]|uniref:hypothetical protein n=1 Tax=Serratia bockelmannii TaxID=2703793 RepID=UPI0029CD22E5|nr:hypothetical protein [Serratia marcescens]
MSDSNDYPKVVNKLTIFRTASGDLADKQLALVSKILNNVNELFERNLQNLTEKEQGRLELYNFVLDEMKECLDANGHYNASLKRDYAEAMSLLAKMHGSYKNG